MLIICCVEGRRGRCRGGDIQGDAHGGGHASGERMHKTLCLRQKRAVTQPALPVNSPNRRWEGDGVINHVQLQPRKEKKKTTTQEAKYKLFIITR